MKKFLAVLLSCLMIFVGMSSGVSAVEITTEPEIEDILEEDEKEKADEKETVKESETIDYDETINATVSAISGLFKAVGMILALVVVILEGVVNAFVQNDEDGTKDRAISVLAQVIDMMSRFSDAFSNVNTTKTEEETTGDTEIESEIQVEIESETAA